MLALSLTQLLWDRGENQGYAQHFTERPLPGIEAKESVLLVEAFGNHQVTNVSDRAARPHDRRVRAQAWPTRQVARSSACRCTASPRSRATRSRARRSSTGTTAPAKNGTAPLGQHRRPARASDSHYAPRTTAGGAAPEGGVPAHRQRDRRLRQDSPARRRGRSGPRRSANVNGGWVGVGSEPPRGDECHLDHAYGG